METPGLFFPNELLALIAGDMDEYGVVFRKAVRGFWDPTELVPRSLVWAACRDGHLGLVKWAAGTANGHRAFTAGCSKIAAWGGRIPVLEWLQDYRSIPWSPRCPKGAARGGELGVLNWLAVESERHCDWGPRCFRAAAREGHQDVLQWLGARSGEERLHEPCVRHAAARGGHLQVLKWLYQKKSRYWDVATCSEAAASGQLEVLKWLRLGPKPCLWDSHACEVAADNGHVETLTWLILNGCRWHRGFTDKAVCRGDLPFLQTALEAFEAASLTKPTLDVVKRHDWVRRGMGWIGLHPTAKIFARQFPNVSEWMAEKGLD